TLRQVEFPLKGSCFVSLPRQACKDSAPFQGIRNAKQVGWKQAKIRDTREGGGIKDEQSDAAGESAGLSAASSRLKFRTVPIFAAATKQQQLDDTNRRHTEAGRVSAQRFLLRFVTSPGLQRFGTLSRHPVPARAIKAAARKRPSSPSSSTAAAAMTRGGVMDAGFVLKLGRIFKTPYGGHGVDFVDQLNYQFTGGLMTMFIAIIGLRQYVEIFMIDFLYSLLSTSIKARHRPAGKPIQCWVPQEFSKAWEDFAENYCWVSSTYFLGPDDDIPVRKKELDSKRFLTYYQWVAIVLAGQAMLTWVPHLVWRVGARRLPVLIKSARNAAIPDTDLRRKAVQCLVAALEEQAEATSRHRRVRSTVEKFLFCCGPNIRLTLLFLLVRLMFIGNAIGQVFLMRSFLGNKSIFFGYEVLSNLIAGIDWKESGNFPRVTFCNIPKRNLGTKGNKPYTVQCVLPVNHFVEKVYIFLWFWFIILAVLTAINTLSWIIRTLIPQQRVDFVKQYLRAMRLISNTEERDCAKFVHNNLGPDGIFILQAVSNLASDLVALDVTTTLWRNYRQAKITGTEDDINRLLESVNRGSSVKIDCKRLCTTALQLSMGDANSLLTAHRFEQEPSVCARNRSVRTATAGKVAFRKEGQFRDAYSAGFHKEASSGHYSSLGLGDVGGNAFGFGTNGPLGAEMDATFMWKLSKLGRIGSSRLRFDDDFADRINYQFTGVILFLFIGLIGIRQYVGESRIGADPREPLETQECGTLHTRILVLADL
uniref:Innexin n=1 Tax=Macrostomum lignano TaxID=282301 RepID=A0A1I8IRV1_9PLAT